MAKTTTVQVRVEPQVKEDAGKVFSDLGLSMTDAVTLFLRQVAIQGGLPFRIDGARVNASTPKS